MRHTDWGERHPRWAGIHSHQIDVAGTRVHYLASGAAAEGPTQLLVHPMAGSASGWLDLIPHLRRLGPVIAPDLPGSVFGHTTTPHPRAVRPQPCARFLRALTSALDVRDALVHGWSMGALVAVLYAALAPGRVRGLVLATPALPGPLPPDERVFWGTIGRALLSTGPPVARTALRLSGRRLLAIKLGMLTDPGRLGSGAVGSDLARLSPEMRALLVDQLRDAPPADLRHAVTAFAATVDALFVHQAPVHDAIAAAPARALLLAGGRDPLVPEATLADLIRRRPDWERHDFPAAGHLLPLEDPDGYTEAVRHWLETAQPAATPHPRLS